jgi:Divergent InlB B-repeat domain
VREGVGAARAALVLAAAFALWAAFAAAAHAGTWCGTPAATDRKPQVVAGYNIHVIYALASDAPDQSATVAQTVQNDVEAIEAWWRAQDPTRSPRFDLTPFACGAQVDLSILRLGATTAELRALDGRFEKLYTAVYGAGFDRPHVKYLIYYDGPVDEKVCGQGGGVTDEGGAAVVYMAACEGVASATTAAHELVHAFAAMPPSGPPHACSPEDTAHACDSEQDLLAPYATTNPLDWYILDVGRDDYYGHSGAWFDLQDSRWLRRLDAQVRVSVQLTGSGSIDSDVPGINCSVSCDSDLDSGSVLALRPTAAAGQRFVRWGGSCSGFSVCSLQLGQPVTVTALFAPATFRLSVQRAGKGTIKSIDGRIACGSRCSASLISHVPSTLTAVPQKGWRFARWSGGCAGTRPRCILPMTAASAARATFVRRSGR